MTTELIEGENREQQMEQNWIAFEEAEDLHQKRWRRFKRLILLPPEAPKKYPRQDVFIRHEYRGQPENYDDRIKRMSDLIRCKKKQSGHRMYAGHKRRKIDVQGG